SGTRPRRTAGPARDRVPRAAPWSPVTGAPPAAGALATVPLARAPAAAGRERGASGRGLRGRLADQVVIAAELRAGRQPAELLHLPRHGAGEMRHGDGRAFLRGEKGGGERDIADAAAGDLEAAGEEAEIDIACEWCRGREDTAPDAFALAGIGEGEL